MTHIQLQLQLVDLIRSRVQFLQLHLKIGEKLETVAGEPAAALAREPQEQATRRDGKHSRHTLVGATLDLSDKDRTYLAYFTKDICRLHCLSERRDITPRLRSNINIYKDAYP